MFTGYAEVKGILRDYSTFTSATPFRVPIPSEEDLRPTAQYPIESDPPDHTGYKAVLDKHFSRAAAKQALPAVEAEAWRLLSALPDDAEVVGGYAVPLFLSGLAAILGLPPNHVDRWANWGVQALLSEGVSDMLSYIDEMVDTAGQGEDFFSHLHNTQFQGRPLSRDEMRGFANLAFAGGRQTVVYAMTTAIEYLATHPQQADFLRRNPTAIPTAVEEWLRWRTPIVHLGRTVTANTRIGEVSLGAGDRVSVCYYLANHDRSVFEQAESVDIERRPNRHLAFGHGPHTCAGAPLARMVLEVGVRALLDSAPEVRLVSAEPKLESVGGNDFQLGFSRLVVKLCR